jgi:oligopeptide/dipeptide ABC transporter ATP-binding protein
MATRDQLYAAPSHPYTRALLSAVPVPEPGSKHQRQVLQGDVPNPAAVPSGCPFHTRCPERRDFCSEIVPELADLGNGHQVACLLRYPDQEKLRAGVPVKAVAE